MRGRAGSAVLLLATLIYVKPAAAVSPGQAFRLEYWAEGRCPDATEFARQIQTRAPRLRPAVADEPALGFYAELVDREGSATGRLTARSSDGREVVREVRGPTCDDVSTALALIAAMAADPSQPVETGSSIAAPPKPRDTLPLSAPELELRLSDFEDRARRWAFSVGGGLGFDSAIAPSPGFGLSVGFDAEAPSQTAFRPLFAVTANRAAAASTQTRAGSASFTWVAFRMAACPLRWPELTPLFVRPCGFFDAGLLSGEVEFAARRQSESVPWFALGGFARVEALVGEVVSFQTDGGVSVPLNRESFGVGDDVQSAFRVPRAGFLGRIGLSYRFQ